MKIRWFQCDACVKTCPMDIQFLDYAGLLAVITWSPDQGKD
jgi:epoxyqueuosine reductase QueG